LDHCSDVDFRFLGTTGGAVRVCGFMPVNLTQVCVRREDWLSEGIADFHNGPAVKVLS
jgi:hypothetical protein